MHWVCSLLGAASDDVTRKAKPKQNFYRIRFRCECSLIANRGGFMRNNYSRLTPKILFVGFILLVTTVPAYAQNDWPQWGGPNRNFIVSARGLAPIWPASGPKQLWSRPLGHGHSSIVTSGNA